MMLLPVPFLPLIISAIIPIAIGYIWYHPKAFGNRWMTLSGVTPDVVGEKKQNMIKQLSIHFVFSLFTSYMMAVLVINMIVVGIVPAIFLAFKIWLAFVCAFVVIGNIYEPKPKPKELMFITLGYYFVSLCATTIVLALWL